MTESSETNNSFMDDIVSAAATTVELSETVLANQPVVPVPTVSEPRSRPVTPFVFVGMGITLLGMVFKLFWVGMLAALITTIVSVQLIWPELKVVGRELLVDRWGAPLVGFIGVTIAAAAVIQFTGFSDDSIALLRAIDWDIVGALGDVLGALGQVLIAVLAVYIAWRQYVISKNLTIQQNILTAQQNLITQQQTIDTYFQGISDLVLDEEGLLEDWPQERAIAEGRTAAILSSVDADGKAKIIRFLSRSKLLTPLKRDQRLGRAILDGSGGYEEDRARGLRVIDLGVMLAKTDLAKTDLRWTDLSEINLVGSDLSGCDLVRANLARTILYGTNLQGGDLLGTRLFYGPLETATPRGRSEAPNFMTGEHTGAVVENADFSGVQRLSDEQRYYCCAWCGEQSRTTIPGGCEGIPNKLGR
ncbi:MAG: pentapeptide repeat-containing protein [Cyanobacteria bacterium P01_H01_bin.121]